MPGLTDMAAAGDRRLDVLSGRRGWQFGLLGAGFALVVTIGTIWPLLGAGADLTGAPLDFRVFWNAARLAVEGHPLAVFDSTDLAALPGDAPDGRWMPWLYPPGYLLAIAPLGRVPLGLGWALFTAISVLAMAWAARPFTRGSVPAWAATSLAVGYLPALTLGQNSLLWLAGLIGALAALRGDRPVLAGLLIGALTLKPQLGPMLALALLAGGYWRVMAIASVAALVLALGPGLLSSGYGAPYWVGLAEMLRLHGENVGTQIADNPGMASLLALLVGLGLPGTLALALQWGVAALAAILLWLIWRRPGVDFDLKAAMLLTAMAVSAPYFWQYEAAILAPAGLFMLRAGVLGPTLPGMTLYGLMWLGAWPAVAAVDLLPGSGFAASQLVAPLALVAFILCARTTLHLFTGPGRETALPPHATPTDRANALPED